MRRQLFPTVQRSTGPTWGGGGVADPFTALQREMNQLFDNVWRGADLPTAGQAPERVPSVDVSEDGTNVYVTADLPGLSEKDVDVTYADGTLRISGEKTEEKTDTERNHHVTERHYGRFERVLPLAREVDAERINAEFKDGVLTVTLPKVQEPANTRKIEVRRAA